jgi:hypothetical protein
MALGVSSLADTARRGVAALGASQRRHGDNRSFGLARRLSLRQGRWMRMHVRA